MLTIHHSLSGSLFNIKPSGEHLLVLPSPNWRFHKLSLSSSYAIAGKCGFLFVLLVCNGKYQSIRWYAAFFLVYYILGTTSDTLLDLSLRSHGFISWEEGWSNAVELCTVELWQHGVSICQTLMRRARRVVCVCQIYLRIRGGISFSPRKFRAAKINKRWDKALPECSYFKITTVTSCSCQNYHEYFIKKSCVVLNVLHQTINGSEQALIIWWVM